MLKESKEKRGIPYDWGDQEARDKEAEEYWKQWLTSVNNNKNGEVHGSHMSPGNTTVGMETRTTTELVSTVDADFTQLMLNNSKLI